MQAFDVLADPVRRRILELLAAREIASGELADVVRAEFGLSQPAVSQHLKVLRESGFARVRPAGTRRLYSADLAPLREVGAWVNQVLRATPPPTWQSLDALATEVARGRRTRRTTTQSGSLPEEKIS